MAAPIVSGIAALSLSILGAATGNFYQAAPLRSLLMTTSDALATPKSASSSTSAASVAAPRPVISSGRVNAFSAVQQAWLLASAQNEGLSVLYPALPIDSPLPSSSFAVQGFTVTYINAQPGDGAARGLPLKQLPPSSVFDVSTQPGGSSFSSFKYSSSGNSSTAVILTAYLLVMGSAISHDLEL